MKKSIASCLAFLLVLLISWGCQKQDLIPLKCDSFLLEYGETLDISQYYEDSKRNELISCVTLDDKDVKYEIKDNKKYPQIGTYKLTLNYSKEKNKQQKKVKLIVQDTKAPVIHVKTNIVILKGTKIEKWNSYFDIQDVDDTTFEVKNGKEVKDDYYKKEGQYSFQAIAKDFSNNQSTIDFNVKVVDVLLCFKQQAISLNEGESKKLEINQKNITDEIEYESANSKIVSVDKNGTISAKSSGKTVVSVFCGAIKDECQITVTKAKNESTSKKQTNPSSSSSLKKDSSTTTSSTPTIAPIQPTKWTLNVPYYNQNSVGSPKGCEAASLLEALNYKGYASSYKGRLADFIRDVPTTDDENPYHGYVGDPFTVDKSIYQSIFPSALVPWAKQFGTVKDISGCGLKGLQNEIKNGNPVVIYVTYKFNKPKWKKWSFGNMVDNMHVMTLCGYDEKTNRYQVADPAPSTKPCTAGTGIYWVDENQFARSYNALDWAIVVR